MIWNVMVLTLAIFGQDTPAPVVDPPSFWTSTQFLGLIGVIVTVAGSFAVAIRTSKNSASSSQNTAGATAAEMWKKIDDVESEVDTLKAKLREWHLHHFRVQQWDITGREGPMPVPPESLLEV